MQRTVLHIVLSALIASAGTITGLSANAARNDENNDSARWSNEDSTPKERYETARKEAAAAYQEAIEACKVHHRGPARSKSLKEAATIYQADLAEAKKLRSQ
jgi:hypothetical protein